MKYLKNNIYKENFRSSIFLSFS